MDDDFTFGASVWASSSSTSAEQSPVATKLSEESPDLSFPTFPSTSSVEDDFTDDAFDDVQFNAPVLPSSSAEDDFGDFGDFEETIEGTDTFDSNEPLNFEDEPQTYASNHEWSALNLKTIPSHARLKEDVDEILKPLWKATDTSYLLNNEDIRQVGGLAQVLVTPDTRALYNDLFQTTLPNIRPPNWIRSRTRRKHLVSLGLPVNLDEVLPHANGRPLPALQITTRPSSAPPGPRGANRINSTPPGSASNSRAGTPRPNSQARASSAVHLGLGPKPEIDNARIDQMLALTPDQLSLLPLATLEAHLTSIRSLTASTASLLTYLLQTRDALQQDSETYNGLIAELVGEAQKMKSGPKTRAGGSRRSSGMT